MNCLPFELPALLTLLNDQVSRRGRVCGDSRVLEFVQFLALQQISRRQEGCLSSVQQRAGHEPLPTPTPALVTYFF